MTAATRVAVVSDDDLTPYQGIPRPTRRTVLAGAKAAAATGVGAGLASLVNLGPVDARSPRPDTWPLPKYGPAGTAANSGAAPPTAPAVDWERDALVGSRNVPASIAVGPDAVYAAAGNVVALGRSDGRRRWRVDVRGGPVALQDGSLYVAPSPDGSDLRAFERDGTRRWSATVGEDPDVTSLVVADSAVFLAGGWSGIHAYSIRGLHRWTAGETTASTVRVADGRLYATGEPATIGYRHRNLLDAALNQPPGRRWAGPVPDESTGLVVTGEAVVVGRSLSRNEDSTAAVLVGRTPTNGTVRWRALVGAPRGHGMVARPLAATATHCLAGIRTASTATFGVAAHRLADGERDWQHMLDQRVTDLAVAGNTALVGLGDEERGTGAVLALDTLDGTERWRVPVGDAVRSLAPVDGTVFVATDDERVLAVR